MLTLTNIEQSKKLRSAGLNAKTADFRYVREHTTDEFDVELIQGHYIEGLFSDRLEYTIPAWSLGTLFELMPPEIVVDNIRCGRDIYINSVGYWGTFGVSRFNISFAKDDLLENVVNCVCWLLEKHHI